MLGLSRDMFGSQYRYPEDGMSIAEQEARRGISYGNSSPRRRELTQEEIEAQRIKSNATRNAKIKSNREGYISRLGEYDAMAEFYDKNPNALPQGYKDRVAEDFARGKQPIAKNYKQYLTSIKDTAFNLALELGMIDRTGNLIEGTELTNEELPIYQQSHTDMIEKLEKKEQERLKGRGYLTRTLENGFFKKKSPSNPPPSNSVSQATTNAPSAPKKSFFSSIFGSKPKPITSKIPVTGGRRSQKLRQKRKNSKTIKRRR